MSSPRQVHPLPSKTLNSPLNIEFLRLEILSYRRKDSTIGRFAFGNFALDVLDYVVIWVTPSFIQSYEMGLEAQLMGPFLSYLRSNLVQHFKTRTWIIGPIIGAIAAGGLFGYEPALTQLAGPVVATASVAVVLILITIAWPLKRSLSSYLHLQKSYYIEVEKRLRIGSTPEPIANVQKAIENLYTPYTLAPKTRYLRQDIEIPLYPPFQVGETVSKLLSLPCFLRLDEIEQLSFAHHIFEGAKHSRREHVLGVMYLMREVCDRFVKAGLMTDRDAEIAQVAALIHDSFHTPYGHALDGVGRLGLKENGPVPTDWKYDRGRLVLALEKDNWFRLVLTEAGLREQEIEVLLRIFRFEKDDIRWLSENGRYLFVANLVQGASIDLDRLDYVNRDAIHTWGSQDVLDYKRLLTNIVPPDKTKWLVLFKEDAADLLRTAEVLRYKNFALVYESDENASAEEMVSHALFRFFKRVPLSRESLRQLLMLSDHELEGIVSRFGGEYERWMVRSAIRECSSYVAIATYPTNLEDVMRESGKLKREKMTEIFSKKTMAQLRDPKGEVDEEKALQFVSTFSKKLKSLQTAKLNPRSSSEAFNEKALFEHNLDEKCSSTIKEKREYLKQRSFPLAQDLSADEPIIFVRGAIEEPWSNNDDVEVLVADGRSMSLRGYFGQRIIASPKIYGIRIFVPLELKDTAEEIKWGFEEYVAATFAST